MRTFIIILVVFGIVYIGYLVLDFMGYYIEWERPLLSVAIGAPIIQAVLQFLRRPEKE